jgi:DNA-binding MarR family transcriptional regulator
MHPAEELSRLISSSFIWMEALERRVLNRVIPPLTTPQYHALTVLAWEPNQSLGGLAARLLTVKSNASGIVDRLESLGLVERDEDPHDARRVLLGLTQAGRDTLRSADEARREEYARIFAGGETERVAALTEMLRDLVSLLQRSVEQERSITPSDDLT